MLKLALLSTAVLLTMSLATATDNDAATAPGAVLAAPADTACLPGRVPDPACTLRMEGPAGESGAPASGLSEFAAGAFDWAPPRQPADGEIILPAAAEPRPSRDLLSALLALGGLVVLLRRRPT